MKKLYVACMVFVFLSCQSDEGLRKATPQVYTDKTIDFGTGYVADKVIKSFIIHSEGSAEITIIDMQCDDPDIKILNFNTSKTGTNIGAKSSKQFTLEWSISKAGDLDDHLKILTNVSKYETLQIQIKGTGLAFPNCDDGNFCTDDAFDRPKEKCVYIDNQKKCNDQNACTLDDKCYAGRCLGSAIICEDVNICTLNLCDPATGCVFPPDKRVCDDHDPCTDNICHPMDGCSYPDAENGTSCGSFDCTWTHICIEGECSRLDISEQTDGIPCEDGDHCTENDACLNGECISGHLKKQEPEVTTTIETFGGEDSFVATDGYRFVFADPDALRIAVLRIAARSEPGYIEHVTTIPIVSNIPPISLNPGYFIFDTPNCLYLLDITDVYNPQYHCWFNKELGNIQVREMARSTQGLVFLCSRDPNPYQDAYIPEEQAEDPKPIDYGICYLRVDENNQIVSEKRLFTSENGMIFDLDVFANTLAWISPYEYFWAEIDMNGNFLEQAQMWMHGAVHHNTIQVLDKRIAVLHQSSPFSNLSFWDVDFLENGVDTCWNSSGDRCEYMSPGCGTPVLPQEGHYIRCDNLNDDVVPCDDRPEFKCEVVSIAPLDPNAECSEMTAVCLVAKHQFKPIAQTTVQHAHDIAFHDNWPSNDIIISTRNGIQRVHYNDPAQGVITEEFWFETIDPFSAEHIEFTNRFLLAHNPLALPLELPDILLTNEEQACPEVGQLGMMTCGPIVRYTGPRHGNIKAIVDDENEDIISIAGPAALGRINLNTQSIVKWELSHKASSLHNPRIMQGIKQEAIVERKYYQPIQTGVEIHCNDFEVFKWDANTETHTIALTSFCQYFEGSIQVATNRFWAYTQDSPLCTGENFGLLYAWRIEEGEMQPVTLFSDSLSTECEILNDIYLRASSNQEHMAVIWQHMDPRIRQSAYPDPSDQIDVRLFIRVLGTDVCMSETSESCVSEVIPRCVTSLIKQIVPYHQSPMQVAVDAETVLVGDTTKLSLYVAWPDNCYNPWGQTTPSQQETIEKVDLNTSVLIPWMSQGRAWIWWSEEINPEDSELVVHAKLREITYDRDTPSFSSNGELEITHTIPQKPDAFFDTGDIAVMTDSSHVRIITPTCK